jgi:hypothetical protein
MKNLEELLQASSSILKTKQATLGVSVLPAAFLLCFSNTLTAQSLASSSVDASLYIDQSQATVTSLQVDFGPYDQRLVEPLSDLGDLQQRVGDHGAAAQTFKQTLHVIRVNSGLYHESQIAVLDKLITSERVLRNWEVVDSHYAYMQHLYQRLYGIDDSRLDAGLQKVASWHVNAFNVNLDGKRFEHLKAANKLFHLLLEVADLTLSADDPKFDFLHRNIAICERQLYLASGLNKEIMDRQDKNRDSRKRSRRRSRNPILADLD